MTPLIDGDILSYELGHSSQIKGEDGEAIILPWEHCMERLDAALSDICEQTEATEEPIVYLTGKTNFRNERAVSKPYKGTRKSEKPFHYDNIRLYLKGVYGAIEVEGFEADDALACHQEQRIKEGHYDTIICSRDKDLRMQRGWHYGWECGKQPEFSPTLVSPLGYLTDSGMGGGLKFFMAQMIMGDTVDNIGGLPRCGPKKAVQTLAHLEKRKDVVDATIALYKEKMGDDWLTYWEEQCSLLWMVNEPITDLDNIPEWKGLEYVRKQT